MNEKNKVVLSYIPHGVNDKMYYPINDNHTDYKNFVEFRNAIFNNKEYEFVVFWNNRNIRRKLPGDIILAYKTFCDTLPQEKSEKCVLIMHTQPIDQNGTDLPAVVENVCPDYDVVFSHKKLNERELNFLYNVADVTINAASNEGFGLGTCESLMAGTSISVNVTGGLQDQCGFRYKGELLTAHDYLEIGSLHNDKEWKDNPDLTWGEWVKPIWPACRSLQGSVQTPYIFDDRPRFDDFAVVLKEWYDMGNEERERCGMLGHDFVNSDDAMMSGKAMGENLIKYVEQTLEKWIPRKRYTIYKG